MPSPCCPITQQEWLWLEGSMVIRHRRWEPSFSWEPSVDLVFPAAGGGGSRSNSEVVPQAMRFLLLASEADPLRHPCAHQDSWLYQSRRLKFMIRVQNTEHLIARHARSISEFFLPSSLLTPWMSLLTALERGIFDTCSPAVCFSQIKSFCIFFIKGGRENKYDIWPNVTEENKHPLWLEAPDAACLSLIKYLMLSFW